jgi:hypothetical protein
VDNIRTDLRDEENLKSYMILERLDGVIVTGMIWLRIGTSGGLL